MRRTVLLPLAYYWMHSCNVYVNVKTYSIGTSVLAPPPLQYCSREEFSCSRAGQRYGFRTRGGIYTYETYSTISTSPRPTQPLTTNQVTNRLVNTVPLAAITTSDSGGSLSHSQLWHSQRLSERSCKQRPIVIRRRLLPARQMSAAAAASFQPLAR